ncbi:MAG: hypothetical protein AAF367_08425 [Pseudomonadota bacterium]
MKSSFAAVIIALPALGIPALAMADEPVMTTSAGVQIATPGVKTISCERIRMVFDELDKSGYRKDSPYPHQEEDRAILAYESALSVEYFWRCANKSVQGVGKGGPDSYAANAFQYGYLD